MGKREELQEQADKLKRIRAGLGLSRSHQVKLPVTVEGETVWLNRHQMSELFDRDIKTIGKHINNALKEELSVDNSTVAKFATVQIEGEREVERNIEYYSLDVIISVGYRVKSKHGVEFRRWDNSVLKQYILKGYAVNDNRIKQLGEVIRIMKRTENELHAINMLSLMTITRERQPDHSGRKTGGRCHSCFGE